MTAGQALGNEDWLRSRTFDFPGVESLPDLLAALGLNGLPPPQQREELAKFTKLAAWAPAPARLRAEAESFLAGRPEPGPAARAAWDPAEHPRVPGGPHGGWFARAPGEGPAGEGFATPLHLLGERILQEWRLAADPDAKQELNLAAAAYDAGSYEEASGHLRKAATHALASGDAAASDRLTQLASQISAAHGEAARLQASVRGIVGKGAYAVPRLLGGGRQTWDGSLTVAPELGSRYGGEVLAQVDWHGHMDMLESVAKGIRDGAEGKGEIRSAASFSVPLHELIHAVIGGRWEAQRRAHDESGRSPADDVMLGKFAALDAATADEGVHVHTAAEAIEAADAAPAVPARQLLKDVTSQIEDLERRGLLARADFHNVGPGGERIPLWRRTPKAVATDPPRPPTPPRPEDEAEAYQNPNIQAIEEGFTELGAIQHAADWFGAVGVGRRPTPMLAVRGGGGHPDPVLKAKLLSELDRRARETGKREWAMAAKRLRGNDEFGAQKQLTALWDQVDVAGPEGRAIGRLKAELVEAFVPRVADNPQWASRRDTLMKLFDAQWAKIQARLSEPTGEGAGGKVRNIAALDQAQRAMRRGAADVLDGDLQGAMEEIGRLQHLGDPEFVRDAETLAARLQQLLETPPSRHATMAEYARRLDDRQEIVAGRAWGHYQEWTKQALFWCEEVAMAEGLKGAALRRRVRELADEINREGVGGKLDVMAGQVARLPGLQDTWGQAAMRHEIRDRWLEMGAGSAFEAAHVRGKAAARP